MDRIMDWSFFDSNDLFSKVVVSLILGTIIWLSLQGGE